MCACAIGSIHSPAWPARYSQSAFARLDLDHALHRSDGEARGARCKELPKMTVRLRHAHEPPLEDGQEDGRREAPVADPHHPCTHADRGAVPVAHARLRGLVLPAVSTRRPMAIPFATKRDVEDRQSTGGEPEGALREPFARERPSDDARQHVPAEPGCDQRPAPDDHQMRVREIADEMTRIAGAREPFGRPRQVLRDHVQAPEHEEGAAGQEVLRELPVVLAELLLGIRLGPDRRRSPGDEHADRRDDDARGRPHRSGTGARRGAGGTWLCAALAQAGLDEEDESASRRGRGRT